MVRSPTTPLTSSSLSYSSLNLSILPSLFTCISILSAVPSLQNCVSCVEESSSPGGQRRPKSLNLQQSDDQISETSCEARSSNYRENDNGTLLQRSSDKENLYPLISDTEHDNNIEFHEDWKNYVVKLSRVLSSFLLSLEDLYPHDFKSSAGKTALPVSSVYGELSVKWIMRVLLTVFPCIEACSNQNQLPNYLRLFVYVLQHYVLFVLRKVLILSPSLLDIYRSEGVWEFIFSENYFYFGPVLVDCASKYNSYSEFLPWSYERKSDSNFTDQQANNNEIEILQVQVISVLELALILTGNSHNLDIKTADWSDNVAPFWPAVIRSAFTWKGFTLLMPSGWKTIKGALVMPLMIQRYK